MRKLSKFEKDILTLLAVLFAGLGIAGLIGVITGHWHHLFTLLVGVIISKVLIDEKKRGYV